MATPSKVRLKPSAMAHMISTTRDTITTNVSNVASVYSGAYIYGRNGTVVDIRLANGEAVRINQPWNTDTKTETSNKPSNHIGNNL